MKSGRKIFAKLETADDYAVEIRKFGNGDLRSLLHYMTHGRRTHTETATGELIMACAIVEAAKRFAKIPKGKGLLP